MQISGEHEHEHELIKVKISDVKLDPKNPNQLTQQQITGLRESMQKYGYLTPIIIDQNNLVADGEHRLAIYKALGYEEIPAYRLIFETETDRRLLRQVMNKLHGEHDRQLDADELASIFENNKLTELSTLIATQTEDLERLILRYHPSLDFRHPEDPAELDSLIDDELRRNVPDTKLGDIYQLGRHRLVCTDATDKRTRDLLLEENKIDMLFTDPPYGISIIDSIGSADSGSKAFGSLGDKNIIKSNIYAPVIGDDSIDAALNAVTIASELNVKKVILWGANNYASGLPNSKGWIVWDKERTGNYSDAELAWTNFLNHIRLVNVM